MPFDALEERTFAEFDVDKGPVFLLYGACAEALVQVVCEDVVEELGDIVGLFPRIGNLLRLRVC